MQPKPAKSMAAQVAIDNLKQISSGTGNGGVQDIAAAQLDIINAYYSGVLDQSQKSFLWALIAAFIGLLGFMVAIGFLLFLPMADIKVGASVITAIGGAIAGFISGINFYLYGLASSQLSAFHGRLDRIQRYSLAISTYKDLGTSALKDSIIGELVNAIVSAPIAENPVYVKPLQPITGKDQTSNQNDGGGVQSNGTVTS